MGQRILTSVLDFFKILRGNPFITSVGFIVFMWVMIPWIVATYEKNAPGANITNYTEGLWWGIVTILTVGYGDRFPVTTEGRVWAGIMMLGGVAGIGIVTAKISSVFLERALRDRRGIVETDQLKNHFIICGWKPEMQGEVRSASIKCDTDVVCLALTQADFNNFCQNYPQFALPVFRRIAQGLMKRLNQTSNDLMMLHKALMEEIRNS